MIIEIDGATGSGKTWLMVRLARKEWKKGTAIYTNFPINFSENNTDIFRWHQLDELYHLNNGIILIDEATKLMEARRWASLPLSFAEKIAQHRHHLLDIYVATQDLGHIDIRVRTNIHERYSCASIFRLPRNERVKPFLQLIRIIKRIRVMNEEGNRVSWTKIGNRMYFISRFFTKDYYSTYADIGFERFLCSIKYQKKLNQKRGEWLGKIYSRELVNQGKARL
jgi:hypothetical protein